MPELVKLYIRHVLIGFAIAAAFVTMLLWFNVMNLWHLISSSDVGIVALIVLWFSHGVVFAGVQFALAVMAMAEPSNGGGGKRQRLLRLVPVLAGAKGRIDRTR
ncbi:MAG TPA: hypothetical protein ENJ68_06025 [Devosia sp.]|nr:hypothetical protein [Devosia sp.]